MGRGLAGVGLVAFSGAVCLLVAGVVAAASAKTTLNFLAVQTSSKPTKNGATFTDKLSMMGKPVGHDRAVCTSYPKGAAQPSGENCRITFSFSKGRIVVTAKVAFGKGGGRLKVVGGSGAYANASGSGRYVNISNTKTGVTINLA